MTEEPEDVKALRKLMTDAVNKGIATIEANEPEIDMEAEIQKVMAEDKGVLSPKQYKEKEKVLRKIYIDGQSLQEAAGLSRENLEEVYAEAYTLYNSGQYKKAQGIFFYLEFLNPKDVRFGFGIAACFHALKEYEKARVYYYRCLAFEIDNPIIYWNIAECYSKEGDKIHAVATLLFCIQFSSRHPSLEKIMIRATAERDYLRGQIIEEMNAKKKEEEAEKSKQT